MNQNGGKTIRGFSPDAVAVMRGYTWPGNVRELEGRVKRAGIMADGAVITAADLDLPLVNTPQSGGLTLKEARERAEKAAIDRALVQTNGNVSQASKLLDISRPTLYELMRNHGIRD
jgi:two-component system NtrC family response regulator